MPTYVYKCDTCGAQFEKFQSFKDEPVRTCPNCESSVRRVFQPVGIVFKGSGWYITDSRKTNTATMSNDDSGKAEKAETNGASDTNKTDAKTETKTDAKTETKTETSSTSAPASDSKSSASTSATA